MTRLPSGAPTAVPEFLHLPQVLVIQLCLTLCDPMDCSLPGSSIHGICQARNTKVGCHFLLQGIFPTQESNPVSHIAAAAAKSLQSCPTLCDPIDGSPPGSAVPGILQARTLEWVAISFSNAWKWKVKVKSLSCARLLATPWTAAHQAPLSMGFSRQEYWSGLPLPSPLPHCRQAFYRLSHQRSLLSHNMLLPHIPHGVDELHPYSLQLSLCNMPSIPVPGSPAQDYYKAVTCGQSSLYCLLPSWKLLQAGAGSNPSPYAGLLQHCQRRHVVKTTQLASDVHGSSTCDHRANVGGPPGPQFMMACTWK